MYRQIKQIDERAEITVATSKSQVSSIHNQIGEEVNVCVEPCRRDTFPAIALVTAYLHDVRGVGRDDSVVVCPVDPYVDEEYFKTIKKLGELAKEGSSNLYLMGIEPTYPSEKYGYILPENKKTVSKVESFREKPDTNTAQTYINAGALWNGGVFCL